MSSAPCPGCGWPLNQCQCHLRPDCRTYGPAQAETSGYSPEIQKLISDTTANWEAVRGSQRLWRWFSLSYASFCVLPRVLMHEMPEEWQHKMAKLLEEFDDAFPNQPDLQSYVIARKGRWFAKWPEWFLNYRHPDPKEIENARRSAQ